MYAKLITVGGGCPPPGPNDCSRGGTPTGHCLSGTIPWGNCGLGYG